MKKRISLGVAAGVVVLAMIFGLLFFSGFFLPKEAKAYQQATAQLEKADAVTLDVAQMTTTKVNGESIGVEVKQVLTYSGQNTRSPLVQMEESFPGIAANDTYVEYYTGNTLYMEVGSTAAFRGKLTQRNAESRYVPITLLNPKQYKEVTAETEGDTTVISFAAPRSGESWAMPKGAQLVTASGSAKLDKDGTLLQMQYTLTYRKGITEVTVDTLSTPREEAQSIALPEDTERFITLSYVDAPRTVAYANARMKHLSSAEGAIAEYTLQEQDNKTYGSSNMIKTYTFDLCQLDGQLQYQIDFSSVSSNTGVSQYRTTYKNGEYAKEIINKNNPYGQTHRYKYSEDIARTAFCKDLHLRTADPKYWKDVTYTSLNGVDYLEFTYTRQWSAEIHYSNCFKTCNDFIVEDSSGYVALDPTTGAVTASGFRNKWRHNTGTVSYITQKDMTLKTPAIGAYQTLTDKQPREETPNNEATPLLYRVTGKNGQKMWLMGTIHVGDARTAYLPQEVYDALKASDALALEIDQAKFQEQVENDVLMAQRLRNLYTATTSSKPKSVLDDDVYDRALKLIKASGNYAPTVDDMKIAMWENVIGNFYLQLGHQLYPEKGVEMRLTQLANDLKKPIREVESPLAQMETMMGWSNDLQELMLTSTLDTDQNRYCKETAKLYELWCQGDENALRKEINREQVIFGVSDMKKDKIRELLDEYDKGMNQDRNKKMLDVAISYLESKDTVFYAVGIAHLLDDTSGLVDALRQKGYTVEAVKYS